MKIKKLRLGAISLGIVGLLFILAHLSIQNAYARERSVTVIQSSGIQPHAYAKRAAYRKKSRARRRGGFPQQRRATGNRVFIFSPRMLRWAAYSPSGRLIRTGRASGGANYCRDIGRSCRTPRGVFRIISKRGAGCRSSRYPLPRGGAPMPYCMFYSKYYAIHGSYHVPNYNASHGCIRVRPAAARWLSHNFIRHGTTVIVLGY